MSQHATEVGPRRDALTLDDVTFSYADGTAVLAGVSAKVDVGSIVGVVGPSGCGKSTLLHLIAGLLPPSGGHIERHLARDPARHGLSMVFQRDTLLPWLTVAENVRLFAKFKQHGMRPGLLHVPRSRSARRAKERELDERVQGLLELAGLEDRAGSYPYQLSGGMRRRVAFLAGVAPHPQILLLDEPFSSVDEPSRIGIHQDVYAVMQRLDMTVILVTHDLAEAITLCDRVLILARRPSYVAMEHVIPFGKGRNMLEIRGTEEYLEFYGRVWEDLSQQIAVSTDASEEPGVPTRDAAT